MYLDGCKQSSHRHPRFAEASICFVVSSGPRSISERRFNVRQESVLTDRSTNRGLRICHGETGYYTSFTFVPPLPFYILNR